MHCLSWVDVMYPGPMRRVACRFGEEEESGKAKTSKRRSGVEISS